MADPTTQSKLRGLVLSATDLRELTDRKGITWPEVLLEDYLSRLENEIILADEIDANIDKKIEDIVTDFTDGSIPFADTGFLVEDNFNLSWDSVNKILGAFSVITTNLLSLGRFIQGVVRTTDAEFKMVAHDVVFCDTTSNDITVELPEGFPGLHAKIINCGESENKVTVNPHDYTGQLIYGESFMVIYDGENIDLNYETVTSGWY